MKKVFRMKDLDCANCANKMERSIQKIEGITQCSVNFLMQKMVLEIDDSADERAVLSAVKMAVKKVEPDTEIVGL